MGKFVVLSCAIIAAVMVAWFLNVAYFTRPIASASILIAVPSGASATDVERLLFASKLIDSRLAYSVFIRFSSAAQHPKPGTYSFRPGSSYAAMADAIARGPEREEVSVTIVEGTTIAEEVEQLEKAYGVDSVDVFRITGVGPAPSTFDASTLSDFGFLSTIPKDRSLEGYLFPDTYRVWKDELPEGLIRKQLETFRSTVAVPLEERRQASGMSWHDVVTLASIVEAEVQTPEDRRIVAGIFLRRMKNGMRLQSDATLNYVIGAGRARASAEDLENASPYNTYKNDGLPPGPIGNPGLDAITAVLEPTDTDYFYFLTDASGKVLYAKTFEEHQRNKVKAYGRRNSTLQCTTPDPRSS